MHTTSLVLAGSLAATVAASSLPHVAVNESRSFEIMLPARDGVNLHTRVVMPRDDSGTQKYITIVDRSPYGYTSLEWIPGELTILVSLCKPSSLIMFTLILRYFSPCWVCHCGSRHERHGAVRGTLLHLPLRCQ
jgi:hypothetical protein